MANPWMKFYPRDWRGDQALRAVSIAARGLWMECLCIMHEASPYGHLVLNGKPVEDDTLARMAGVSVDEVASLLGELRQAGVLSVTRKGVIFSRRMTKDHARAQKGKAAVKKRWNKREDDKPQAPDTKQKSGAPNRYPNSEPITQKPKARVQIEEGGGGDARARDPDPPPSSSPDIQSEREQLLEAMGADPSGMTGHGGRMIGGLGDMAEFRRWRNDLGLSTQDIVACIREVMAGRREPGPPSTFTYFTKAMQRLAADRSRPKLVPLQGYQTDDQPDHDQPARQSSARGHDPASRAHEARLAAFARAVSGEP